uniref:Uncharacterized protein n=1 Tax=Melopsittacus undulatus TaxID=13146 RepID=A0A8V5GP96_MELUD
MNKTKGAFESPEFWSLGHTQSNPLISVAPPFVFGQQAMDKAPHAIIIVALFVIMVSLGCTMEIASITAHLRKPRVAIGVVAQHGIMPLTASVLGKLFQLGATESMAILICGCCPGGNLSNTFSPALRGDMNLSTVMTTCSTLLAIGLMPLLLYLYSGGLYEGDLEGKIPCKGIITSLVLMLIPSMLLSSAAIIVLSVANMGSSIRVVFSPSLLGSSALMPFIGFLLGYALSAVFKLNDAHDYSSKQERSTDFRDDTANLTPHTHQLSLSAASAPKGYTPLLLHQQPNQDTAARVKPPTLQSCLLTIQLTIYQFKSFPMPAPRSSWQFNTVLPWQTDSQNTKLLLPHQPGT